jgi:hypothetical protein
MLVIAATAGAAYAHGAGKHLMGTAESVSAEHLVVKDHSGTTHDVPLGPDTRYRNGAGSAAKISDVKVGDRVVVHLAAHDHDSPAAEIRFEHPASGKAR